MVGTIVLFAGFSGYRLVPDSYTYARRGIHFTPYPLAWIPGAIAGINGVIVANAIAATLLVFLVSEPRVRTVFSIVTLYFLVFPGMDAIGALAIGAAIKYRSKLPAVVAFLIHPVSAIVSIPILVRFTVKTLALSAVISAFIIGAFVVDGITMHSSVSPVSHALYLLRYTLPLIAALAVRTRNAVI